MRCVSDFGFLHVLREPRINCVWQETSWGGRNIVIKFNYRFKCMFFRSLNGRPFAQCARHSKQSKHDDGK